MTFPTPEWGFALFFLLSMIVVARLRKVICAIDRGSFNNIVGGLSLLSLFSLAKMYHGLGLMQNVPFVSEALFFQLIYWIGVISGLTFLLHGLSTFLPIARHNRDTDRASSGRLQLLRKTEQLVGVENRLDHLLEGVLGYMTEVYKFDSGAVFKYSARSGKTRLAALTPNSLSTAEEFGSVSFNQDHWRGHESYRENEESSLISNLPAKMDRPQSLLPIVVDNEPVGFFLLWQSEKDSLDREDHLTLKTVTDIVARKILHDRNRIRYDFLSRCEGLRRRMQTGLVKGLSLKEGLHEIKNNLVGYFEFSLISLTITDGPGGSHRRLSAGANDSVLDEKGLAPSGTEGIIGRVCTEGKPSRVTDLDLINLSREDILSGSELKSALAVPIHDDHKVVAVLLIADERRGHFTVADKTLLSYATPAIAQLVRDERYRVTVLRREKRISRISRFVQQSLGLRAFDQVASVAARLIAEELSTCQVRISLIEEDGAFLHSCALASRRDIRSSVPANGNLVVSLMPNHKLVIESGRQLIINQADDSGPIMSEAELTQALNPSLSSTLLVPIRIGEKVVGIMSIGEMRRWQRFQFEQADILFTEAIAEILALALTADKSLAVGPTRAGIVNEALSENPSTRTQVRSSLTGILGSVEIIKTIGTNDPNDLERYLGVINRSARKIEASLRLSNAPSDSVALKS